MSEAENIRIILHLGRNKGQRFFIPVRAHYRAALQVIRNFTRFVVHKRGVDGYKIARTVHCTREGKGAVRDNIAQI